MDGREGHSKNKYGACNERAYNRKICKIDNVS
jgi:hypothetical protein